ncbi:hypothetical protein HDU98_011983 [Podochytrium sp. JEL0797]|nr:hypothetical protein HDU98_011983 [Podochytrium sp. JEL0797]
MFSWAKPPTSPTSPTPVESSALLHLTDHIVETSNPPVFSLAFKNRFVESLADAVAVFEAHRASSPSATADPEENKKLISLLGAPFTALVVGARGLGKSSLINAVFNTQVAQVPSPDATPLATSFLDPAGFARIIDSQLDIQQLSSLINSDSVDAPHIDMIWLLVDRILDKDIPILKSLVDKKVPLIIILAKCDLKTPEQVDTLRTRVHSILTDPTDPPAPPSDSAPSSTPSSQENLVADLIQSLDLDTAIRGWDTLSWRNPPPPATLTCQACGSHTPEPKPFLTYTAWYCTTPTCPFFSHHHLQLLDTRSLMDSLSLLTSCIHTLLTHTPHRRFQHLHLLTTPLPHYITLSTRIITTATLAAAGIGAAPIPFADTPLLLATQSAMILSLTHVFGLHTVQDMTSPTFYWSLLAASPFPFVGIVLAGAAKTIPGVGSVGAAVVEAPVAAGLTLAMGVAVLKTCVALHTRGEKEFVYDAGVQGMVSSGVGESVGWVKGVLVGGGGGGLEKRVGERVLREVEGVPVLEFEGGAGGAGLVDRRGGGRG